MLNFDLFNTGKNHFDKGQCLLDIYTLEPIENAF